MVFEERETKTSMSDSSSSTRHLHNFDLPYLKWGNQKVLRCQKEPKKRRRDFLNCDDDDDDDNEGIDEFREKVMLNFEASVKKMKDSVFGIDAAAAAEFPVAAEVVSGGDKGLVNEEARQWNLRARKRGVAVAVEESGDKRSLVDVEGEEVRPWNLRARKRGVPEAVAKGGGREVRKELSVQLNKEDIEADYLSLFGRRPPRRPRRRPRSLQRDLDVVFPGLGLTEITADKYKIREENGKK